VEAAATAAGAAAGAMLQAPGSQERHNH